MAEKRKETRNNIRSFLKYRFLISYLHITELLQRRDLYNIFAEARQGPFCPFTFPFFSRATTFLASAFGGLRESHTLSLHPRARFFFKKKEKKKVAGILQVAATFKSMYFTGRSHFQVAGILQVAATFRSQVF